jgi:hypothetical protein
MPQSKKPGESDPPGFMLCVDAGTRGPRQAMTASIAAVTSSIGAMPSICETIPRAS